MNSKILVVAFVALFALAYAQNQFCDTCQKIAQDEKNKYNNDFSSLTEQQLITDIDGECNQYYPSGIENSLCKQIIQKNAGPLLADLKAGDSNQQCCHDALPDLGC